MSSDPSGAAPIVPLSLPDPFAQLSRFDNFRAAVEPLAAEFWAAREPLKNALVALEHGWNHDPTGYAVRCLAVGAGLQKAGMSAFPAEMANAVKLDAAPPPEQVATQATWCVLAAATANDGARVAALLNNLFTRSTVSAEFSDVLADAIDTCLAKWRCVAMPPFVDRLRGELARLNLTPTDAMEWMQTSANELTTGARRALRDWLYAIQNGQLIAMNDTSDSWGPEVPGKPFRQWLHCNPVFEERRERKAAKFACQAQAALVAVQGTLTPPDLTQLLRTIQPGTANATDPPVGTDETTESARVKSRVPKADAAPPIAPSSGRDQESPQTSATASPNRTQQSEGEKPPAADTPDKPTDSILPDMLSASDIAKRIKRNPKSVTSFLTRFAAKNRDCRVEIVSKRKNEPGYLYRTADVWPALEKWMKDDVEN